MDGKLVAMLWADDGSGGERERSDAGRFEGHDRTYHFVSLSPHNPSPYDLPQLAPTSRIESEA